MDLNAESKLVLRKVLIDIVCLGSVGFSVLFFYLFGEPYKRGFFCNDDSIRYPFKESTVTSTMLYFVGLVFPICVMMGVEWVHYRSSTERQPTAVKFGGRTIHPWLWRCYCVIGVFGFGAACSQLLTDIAKYSIGRLRPHFWDVCQPTMSGMYVNCTLPENQNRYIENFSCRHTEDPKEARKIREVRLSFLSGHSSFSFYTMVFLALYVQCRVHWRGSHLIRHFVQFLCISLAWFTALSRVSNYKHHWSDVLAGSLLGITIAIIVVKFVSDLQLDETHKYTQTASEPSCEPTQTNNVTLTVTNNS